MRFHKGDRSMKNNITVRYLADVPEQIQTCASWAYSQWGCQSGGSLEHSIARFSECARKEGLPLTLVAMEGDKPAGMASLWRSDYEKRADLLPWLAPLFVHPFYRGQGIASGLIREIEQEAAKLGFYRCFLVTEEARKLYERFGWREMEPVTTCYGDASLMTKDLFPGRIPFRES